MKLFCKRAWLPEGWTDDVVVEIGDDGGIVAVASGQAGECDEVVSGPVLPGVPNLHSHTFQRIMAGLAEVSGSSGDSFWTWRDTMYGFVTRLAPEQVEAIAAQAYVEMIKAGYTAVGEFHYLHHDPDGNPYADPGELSERVIAAAQAAGIGITHLPVLYANGGFDGQPVAPAQKRFFNDPERFLRLLGALRERYTGDPQVRVGIAPHSLRAVTPDTLTEVVTAVTADNADTPIHIHVAEQRREVEDCLSWSGQRPVEWLLAAQPVNGHWCLVHATHVNDNELSGLAACGAVAGLCPTTEANLGDGIFPAAAYMRENGRMGIGSDSQVSISPVEELRWLEYGQRLVAHSRNVLAGGPGRSTGERLFGAALDGGARALGRPIGRIARDARADLLVLDRESPGLCHADAEQLIDAWIFSGNTNPVRDVMVGGRWRVRDGAHHDQDAVRERFVTMVRQLRDGG